jgi:hypothetical protein
MIKLKNLLSEKADPALKDGEKKIIAKAMSKAIGNDVQVNGDDVEYHTGTSTFYAGNGGETQLFVGYYEDEDKPYNVSIEDGSKQYAQVDAKNIKDVVKAVVTLSKKFKNKLLESVVVEDYSSHYSPQVGLFYLEGVPFTKERIVEVIKYFRSAKIKSAVSQFEYRPTLLIKDKENNESVTIDARRLKTLIDFYKKDSAKLASDKDFK